MLVHVPLPFVHTPRCPVCISWETLDGYSGSTTCEAWRGQYEIEKLEKAGYVIRSITRG